MDRLGFVGLGDMGGAIVTRALDVGIPTVLWARRPESLDSFADAVASGAASVAASRAALAASSDVVAVCVFDDADVRAVALGDDGLIAAMPPASVLLIHSTVSVDLCTELAGVARPRGVTVLDAPVTGGRPRALTGELTVMVGGDPAALERVRPLLAAYATRIVHLGPLGAGQTTKALNSALHWATGEAALAALDLAQRFDLDRGAAVDILRAGAAGSGGIDLIADRLSVDATFARHVHATVQKDLAVLEAVLERYQVNGGELTEFCQARSARNPAAPLT